ncbi:hypothetical protein CsSME_00030351 [Camellia sinensis var. sinensis]
MGQQSLIYSFVAKGVENEYQTIEGAFHEKGPAYVRWAAQMAVGLQTGVPWTMCKQIDAPDPVVSLIRQPKWGHLKELHAAIKLCSETLLTGSLTTSSIGEQQEAYVFQGQPGQCAAFLVNNDGRNDVQVMFQNSSYELPRKSISILPDCKTVAFNTAKASSEIV